MPLKPFRPGFEAVAAKPFTSAGVKYGKSERYPYRDLGVIDFDLRGLWGADLIEFTDEAYRAAPPATKATKPSQNPLLQPPRR